MCSSQNKIIMVILIFTWSGKTSKSTKFKSFALDIHVQGVKGCGILRSSHFNPFAMDCLVKFKYKYYHLGSIHQVDTISAPPSITTVSARGSAGGGRGSVWPGTASMRTSVSPARASGRASRESFIVRYSNVYKTFVTKLLASDT